MSDGDLGLADLVFHFRLVETQPAAALGEPELSWSPVAAVFQGSVMAVMKCPFCQKEYKRKGYLSDHLWKHHEIEIQQAKSRDDFFAGWVRLLKGKL